MMVIISDTGPLNYLIQIEEIDVLPKLFGRVILPNQVLDELKHDQAPALVRNWVGNLPEWVELSSPEIDLVKMAGILGRFGSGEISAMAVALKEGLPVLMDDRRAREAAAQIGIHSFGTLAVLGEASLHGWLDFRQAVECMREKGAYLKEDVILRYEAELKGRGKKS